MLNTDSRCKGFLGDLGSSIKRYPYKGWQDFLDTWNAECRRQQNHPEEVSEWMLLTDVDQHIFNQDFRNSVEQLPDWTSYDAALKLLLVKMPNLPPHELAITTFGTILDRTVQPTGIKSPLLSWGHTTYYGSDGSGKSPDGAWTPRRLPRDRSDDWPAVVLQVAYTESQSKLNSDVRFWLYESQGDVKIVLTLTVDRNERKITIEKWEPQNERIHQTQNVTISSKNGQVTVTNSPLVIEFEKLFLRPATIPRERDIEIDAEQLEDLAKIIWEKQGI